MSGDQNLAVELEKLTKENRQLRELIKGYEEVLKLNEREILNANDIIKMYENTIEFSREEMKSVRETIAARERVAVLCDEEKKQALLKIRELSDNSVI